MLESKKRANDKYFKKAIKCYTVQINRNTENDLIEGIEWLKQNLGCSMNSYFKDLIADDIARRKMARK